MNAVEMSWELCRSVSGLFWGCCRKVVLLG